MNRLVRFHRNCRRHLLLIAGVALSAYFSYHTVFGGRSYAHLQELNTVVAQKEQEHAAIQARRLELQHDVTMLRPETLSVDLLEERARLVLGYKHPEELVVFRN